MKSEQKNNSYSTRDLNLATTLITLHFIMEGVDYQIEGEKQRPVGYFNFEDSEELQNAIKKFWSGDLSVEPRQFMNNLRGLKAQINSFYKSPHSNF